MWVSSKLVTQERDSESFTKRCTVTLRVEGMAGKDAGGRVVIGGMSHNRTRTLQCDANSCASFIVMHLGVLEYPRYLINISFAGLESVDRHFNIVDIIFTVITYNPDFTKMELWFRLFFVATTAVIAIVFLVGGMKNFVNLDEWAIEQKWVALLLPLLLAFDDPLFPMTLTSSNLFAAVCDAVFQVSRAVPVQSDKTTVHSFIRVSVSIHVRVSDHFSLRTVALLAMHSSRTSTDRARVLQILCPKAPAGRRYVGVRPDHRRLGDHKRTEGPIIQLSA